MDLTATLLSTGWASGVNAYLTVAALGVLGIRLGVNASPEPFSNIAISLVEDGLAFTVAAFAINHPVLAASVAAALLVLGLCAVVLLWKALRRRRSAAGPEPPGG